MHALILAIPIIIGIIIGLIAISQSDYISEKQVAIIVDTETTTNYLDYFNEETTSKNLYILADVSVEDAKKEVEDGKYHGLVIVNEVEGIPNYKFITNDFTNAQLSDIVVSDFEKVTSKIVYDMYEIDENFLDNYELIKLKEDAISEENASILKTAVIAIVILISFVTAPAITLLGQDIIYEKSDRVMELILSSISTTELFISKILVGVFLTLTEMLLIFSVLGIAFIAISTQPDIFDKVNSFINEINILYVLVFSIPLILLFFIFYLVVVIVFNSFATDQETGGLWATLPALLMGASFYVAIFLNMNPNTPITRVLSFIPPFSGLIMPMRIVIFGSEVPIWEVSVSILILLITTALILFFGNKIFAKTALYYSQSSKKNKFKVFVDRIFTKKK